MRIHESDDYDTRRVAGDWHGGQSSALYAYASSGAILPYATLEASRIVEMLANGYDPGTGDDPSELANEADALLDVFTRYEDDIRAQARELGEEAALAAASWAADVNTSHDAIVKLLAMIDDGDPAADDYMPRRPDLSGEFADDATPQSLARDIIGEDWAYEWSEFLADEFEDAVSDVFEDAVVRELRAWL